jgi:asparagine synthase (glutamine-hydrolysing)
MYHDFVVIMTGIAGMVSKIKEPVGENILKMLNVLSHRGKDHQDLYLNGNLVRLTRKGNQEKLHVDENIGAGVCWDNKAIDSVPIINTSDHCILLDGESQKIGKILSQRFSNGTLEENLRKVIEQIHCGFSLCFLNDNKLILARDMIGFKPLYFCDNNKNLAFSSEKKGLWAIGIYDNINALNPGELLIFDNRKKTTKKIDCRRGLFEFENNERYGIFDCRESLPELLIEAVSKHIKSGEIGLLFSGGLDSCILAQILKNQGIELHLYNAGFINSHDRNAAIFAGKIMGLDIKLIELNDNLILENLEKIVYHLETNDTVTAEIGTPFYFITQQARTDGFSTIMTGQGADELFGGYSRYEKDVRESGYSELERAIRCDVTDIWKKNLMRDEKICMANGIDLLIPYLYKPLVDFSMRIDPKLKLKKTESGYTRKYILREIGRLIGLDTRLLTLPKKAVQYGSGTTKAFRRIANESLTHFNLDKNKLSESGFRSSNDFFMNLISFQLKFPIFEIKNLDFFRNLLIKNSKIPTFCSKI